MSMVKFRGNAQKFFPMKKDLAIGYDSFSDLIGNNCYYVDKTQFLKTVLQDKSKVMLITRPRRFGKTLFMSTLESFLRIDLKNPGSTHTQECYATD